MTKEVLVKRLGDLLYYPMFRVSKYYLQNSHIDSNIKIIGRKHGESYLVIEKNRIYCQSVWGDGNGEPRKLHEMYMLMIKHDGYNLLGIK